MYLFTRLFSLVNCFHLVKMLFVLYVAQPLSRVIKSRMDKQTDIIEFRSSCRATILIFKSRMIPAEYRCCLLLTLCLAQVLYTAEGRSFVNSKAQQLPRPYIKDFPAVGKKQQFDDGPVVRTETLEAWSDKKKTDSDRDDEDEEVDEALVSNDDEDTVGLPEKAEKAPSVLIEKEKDHIVWGMWGPWGSCSGTCGAGHTRKRRRKCARGACHGGVAEEELESCNDKPCQTDIGQLNISKTAVKTSSHIF